MKIVNNDERNNVPEEAENNNESNASDGYTFLMLEIETAPKMEIMPRITILLQSSFSCSKH